MIPKAFIQEVIERTDIAAVIGTRITLKKQGQTYVGRCPFHQEKTPSFKINSHKQFYYCFGCGAHGNVISFLLAYDHLEFRDAIEQLAAPLGLSIPQTTSDAARPQEPHDKLYALLSQINHYFQQQLRNTQIAIAYLKSRGISGQIAKHFQLGYAPNHWDNLIKLTKGKESSQLLATGMIIEKNPSHYYDRFRHRIMFPIHNPQGRIVGFGGRCLGEEKPKYLNSPETIIFHKNQELYGLYQTLQKRKNLEKILVVEGYMDVIALFQYGIDYAVATLGTAINRQHIQKLLRYCPKIIFCFDADQAGQNAAWKALSLALPLLRDGIHFRFLSLPKKHDPDSLIREIGQAAFEKLIDEAPSLNEIFFDKLKKDHPTHSIEEKAHFAKIATEYIETMPMGIYRQLMQEQVAQILNIKDTDLDNLAVPKKPPSTMKPIKNNNRLNSAQLAIAILLQQPKLITHIPDAASFKNLTLSEIPLLCKLIQLLQQTTAHTMGSILSYWENPEEKAYLAQLCAKRLPIHEKDLVAVLTDTIAHLQVQNQKQQLTALIEQAKIRELNETEKQTLRQLLHETK